MLPAFVFRSMEFRVMRPFKTARCDLSVLGNFDHTAFKETSLSFLTGLGRRTKSPLYMGRRRRRCRRFLVLTGA